MESTLISSEMHLVWPDSRSNRRARADGEAAKRTAKRRSTEVGSHLGAGDPGRRAAMAGDRSAKQRSADEVTRRWCWAFGFAGMGEGLVEFCDVQIDTEY